MRFRKFIINKYRAVNEAEVPVGNNLIPLIGINESGKTSILQAILAFDKNSDTFGKGAHLEFKNKYETKAHPSSVAADIVIDDEKELKKIAKGLDLAVGHDLYEFLQTRFKSQEAIHLIRDLDSRKYSIDGFDDTNMSLKLAKNLYSRLPFILYFDDFTDRVPEKVAFTKAENRKGYQLRGSRLAQWQRVLEEVLSRATDGEYPLSDFIKISDRGDRDGVLSDVNDVLNDEIITAWRELKKWGGNLADDPDQLELDLRYDDEDEKGFSFQFKVADRSRSKRRFFNINDRSKGFQWFFNFQMKLKFNPKYLTSASGAIYLLDEPGSYLHLSAQEELLTALGEISNTNTILYCTHSQHLLDPNKINIGQTRIVSKEEGAIRVIPYGSAPTRDYQGALSPLFDALRIRTGIFNRKIEKVVITEGITDYYFLRLLQEFNDNWGFDKIDVIPGAGADQLKDLISMSIAWAEDFVVLLDSDTKGITAKKRYGKFFGAEVAKQIWTYERPSHPAGVLLEDFLSPQDRNKVLRVTSSKDLKAAIISLYHGNNADQDSVFAHLTKGTMENLSLLHNVLSKLANS